MSWFNKFLNSSLGNKLLMSATGLFLTLFLVVHLAGNLQLLIDDAGESFNSYVEVMESNLLIKTIALLLYVTILIHAYKGIVIYLKNRKARGSVRYSVKSASQSSWASRNMVWLGTLIFIFLAVHMSNFWYLFKFGNLEEGTHFLVVQEGFSQLWIVVFYVLAQLALAGHLIHGFQSAFQTLGWRHGKYTSLIHNLGMVFSIIVPLLFALIPILMYLGIYPLSEFKVIPGQ